MSVCCPKQECVAKKGLCHHEKIMLTMLAIVSVTGGVYYYEILQRMDASIAVSSAAPPQ